MVTINQVFKSYSISSEKLLTQCKHAINLVIDFLRVKTYQLNNYDSNYI